MAKKDISANLKYALRGAAVSVKEAAKDVKLPEIKAPAIKVPSQVKDVFKKKEKEQTPVTAQTDAPTIGSIPTKNAIKIIYYLMAADGEIYHSEEEKFYSICTELDPEFAKNKEKIIDDCRKQLDKAIGAEDYGDVIQDGVSDAIQSSLNTAETIVTPKFLLWNLLAIAYSDENYNETERKLLNYIVRKLNIDKAVFLEMENSILTLMDLEKELQWIKTTDRPYLTIEAIVTNIENRKNIIFESVKELIFL